MKQKIIALICTLYFTNFSMQEKKDYVQLPYIGTYTEANYHNVAKLAAENWISITTHRINRNLLAVYANDPKLLKELTDSASIERSPSPEPS